MSPVCKLGTTIDLGDALDDVIEGALAEQKQKRSRGSSGVSSSGGRGRGHASLAETLGDGLMTMAYRPIPFALGATVVPGGVGFLARVLSAKMSVPQLATRGVAFAATVGAALYTASPFAWGAFIGQLPMTMDMLAGAAADALLGTRHGRAAMPAALPEGTKVEGFLGSAEPYSERAAAGAVSQEDLDELQQLKADLMNPGVSGVSDQRRTGFQTGDIAAAASTPSRFH